MKYCRAISFIYTNIPLLLSDINIDRCTGQIPLLTHFIFQETFVRFLHILRQIGEIYK